MQLARRAAWLASRSPRSRGCPRAGPASESSPTEQAQQALHPVQQAWIDEQVPMCGFCQNGMMIKATELLESNVVAERGADQGGIHERPVAAPVPLRNVLSHPGGRAARGGANGKGEVASWTVRDTHTSTARR